MNKAEKTEGGLLDINWSVLLRRKVAKRSIRGWIQQLRPPLALRHLKHVSLA